MPRLLTAALVAGIALVASGCDTWDRWEAPLSPPRGSVSESTWVLRQSSSSFGQCYGARTAQGHTFTSNWSIPCANWQIGQCVKTTASNPPSSTFPC